MGFFRKKFQTSQSSQSSTVQVPTGGQQQNLNQQLQSGQLSAEDYAKVLDAINKQQRS